MTVASTSRMTLPLMALVVAGGIALALGLDLGPDLGLDLGIQHVHRDTQADIKAPIAARAVPEPSSGARDQGLAALAAARADLNAAAADATASYMIAPSRINPDNSPWSHPGFLQALTA